MLDCCNLLHFLLLYNANSMHRFIFPISNQDMHVSLCSIMLFVLLFTIALDTIYSGNTCNKFNQNWTCCYNQYLDETTSQCVECRDGTFGWNCNTTCYIGYYGHLCREHCECEDHLCNPVTGCPQRNNIENHATNRTTTDRHSKSTSNSPRRHTIWEGIFKPDNNQTKGESKRSTPTSGKLEIESSNKTSNKTSNESNDWMLIFFLFITSLISILIGGVLFYVWPFIKRSMISREHHNQERERITDVNSLTNPSETNIPTVTISSVDERSSNYDDIRYSKMVQYKQNFSELRSSSNGRAMKNSCKIVCSQSVLYDKYIDYEDDDYSRLLLRKKQSIFVARNNILLKEGDYAYLQTKGTGRKHLDVTIRRSQSLSQGTGRKHLDFTIRRSQSLSQGTGRKHINVTIRRSQSLSQGTGRLNPNFTIRRSQSLSRDTNTPQPDFTITRSQSLSRDTSTSQPVHHSLTLPSGGVTILSHGTGIPRSALTTTRSQSLSQVAGRPHPAFIFRGSNSRNQREEALENYKLV